MIFLTQSLDAAYDFLTAEGAVLFVESRYGDGLWAANYSELERLGFTVSCSRSGWYCIPYLRARSVLARSEAQTVMPTRTGIESAMREGGR